MQAFVIALVIQIIATVITIAMTPKPKPPAVGQLDVPTAEEGGNIPVVFGTDVIKQSNVIYYGDASTAPIWSDGGKK